MLYQMLNYILKLTPGTTFTYKDICIACFGKPYKCEYLAFQLQAIAFKNHGYIVISSTSSGVNIYRKI